MHKRIFAGGRVRVRCDGELGRSVAMWLSGVGLFPPEKHMEKNGVVERPNFEVSILDGCGAASVTAVFLDGE